MSALFQSGRIVDLVIAFALIEGLALWAFGRRTGRGIAAGEIVTTLLPGLLLLATLRLALGHAPWHWLAGCLLLALVAHISDLKQRWKRAGRRPNTLAV